MPNQLPRAHRSNGQKTGFKTSARSRQEAYPQRYGPAHDPASAPPLPPPKADSKGESENPKSLATAIEKEVKTPNPKREEKKTVPAQKPPEKAASIKRPQDAKNGTDGASSPVPQVADQSVRDDASESHPKEDVQATTGGPVTKPLERVLQMESPEDHKPPHLQAPPYVHHFDTFTLVKNLQNGGFTEAQSITLMKAVRGLLAQNLDVARQGLVSKSDVENVCARSPHAFSILFPFFYQNIADLQSPGDLPLPRGLLRTPHRDPLPPPRILHHPSHPARSPPTLLRHPLATRIPRISRPERRSPRPAQRPQNGCQRAKTGAGLHDPGTEL